MIDILVVLGALGVPAVLSTYTVWMHPNWKGVLLAIGTLWILGFMLLVGLMVAYEAGPPAVVMMGVWLLWGWAVSAVYCVILARVRVLRLRSVPSAQEPVA
jgi:hypothetical protein